MIINFTTKEHHGSYTLNTAIDFQQLHLTVMLEHAGILSHEEVEEQKRKISKYFNLRKNTIRDYLSDKIRIGNTSYRMETCFPRIGLYGYKTKSSKMLDGVLKSKLGVK